MKRFNNNTLALVSIVFIILIGIGIYFLVTRESEGKEDKENNPVVDQVDEGIKIVDVSSTSRPFAVMINNHDIARANHMGLQDAYIVYEMIVEGGITRLMAVFKDVNVENIGSVRSSRHYFLDYAMENDAYYVHWGWSPQAQSDISTYRINNINGLTYEGKYFIRKTELNVPYEHTGFTSTAMLNEAVKALNYRTETNKPLLLDYSADSVDYSSVDGVKDAKKVTIRYSNYMTTSYEYDEEAKVYKRFANGEVHKDAVTGKQYTAKNIITYQVANSAIANDNKGRQEFDNLGSGDGYLITEGKAIPIKWSKDKRENQTKYTYLNGDEIVVNDGNTYIQIQPKGQNLVIE